MAKKQANKRGYATTSIPKQKITQDPEISQIQENVAEIPPKVSELSPQVTPLKNTPEKDNSKLRILKNTVEKDMSKYNNNMLKLYSTSQIPTILINQDTEDTLKACVNQYSAHFEFNNVGRVNDLEKSIQKVFLYLEKLNFSRDIIKDSLLKACPENIQQALEWMCFNLPPEDLPSGFSDKLIIEETCNQNIDKSTPQTIPALKDAVLEPFAKINSILEPPNTPKIDSIPKKINKSPNNLKSSILASMKWLEIEDDIEEEKIILPKKSNEEQYINISLELHRAKRMASIAKASKNISQQKEENQKIRNLNSELKSFESLKNNESLNQDILQLWKDELFQFELEEKKLESTLKASSIHSDEGDDEANISNIFEVSDSAETEKKESNLINIIDLSYKKWTGLTAKTLLTDWIKINMHKTSISISLLEQESIGYRAKITITADPQTFVYEMSANEQVSTKADAKQYVSLKALFDLNPSCKIQDRISPPFKDLWNDWVAEREKNKLENIRALDEDREKFIESLVSKIKLERKNVVETSFQKHDIEGANNGHKIPKHSFFDKLGTEMQSRKLTEEYKELEAKRMLLPIYAARESILEKLSLCQVMVIAGETGSGKSTQTPQFILEDAFDKSESVNIVCTQPRRISATSIANRVSFEMGEGKGAVGKYGSFVGYQVRMENCVSKTTRLTFCTTVILLASFNSKGILLRRLITDPELKDVSHVIVDEVHERSVDSDFLLLLLKKLKEKRSDLKIILMSATVELEKFVEYFKSETQIPAVLSVPGKVFPVTSIYLDEIIKLIGWTSEINEKEESRKESQKIVFTGKGGKSISMNAQWEVDDFSATESYDSLSKSSIKLKDWNEKVNMDLLESLIIYVVNLSLRTKDRGSVLVFLPGAAEIKEICERLEVLTLSKNPIAAIFLPLYSELTGEEQSRVFDPAPTGFIKVVISTNIAETGITIPDTVYVIDTCKAKEITYDPNRHLTCLREIIVSKANCKQRKGRAGRVKSGVYFNLLPESVFEALNSYRPPEILRLPLEDLCLKARATLGNAKSSGSLIELFANALDPPPTKNLQKAISLLQQVQAMLPDENLTPIGHCLSKLGMDVRIGKMLLYSISLKCMDPILTIAASLSLGKSPFLRSNGDSNEYKRVLLKFKSDDSDLLMIYNAYTKWKKFMTESPGWNRIKAYCNENYLSINNLKLIDTAKKQILKNIMDTGVISRPKEASINWHDKFNTRSGNSSLVLCTLSACLYPNIMYFLPKLGAEPGGLFLLGKNTLISVNHSSILHERMPYEPTWFASHVIKATQTRNNGQKAVAWDLNRTPPLGVVSLIAEDVSVDYFTRSLCMDNGNIRLKAFPSSATIIARFSKLMHMAIQYNLGLSRYESFNISDAETIIEAFVSVI